MGYIKVTTPIIDVNEEEATVTDILCKEEEKVDIGDLLFVVENTKATNNIVSEKEGYILNLCDSFDTKKNGDSLALIFDSIAVAKSAEIRRGVQIGVGNIIGAGCYIGTLTCIGNNNTISYGAKIGHHNIIGSHNLIAPNVCTSGSDNIGNSCIIPAGISVINRASIGDEVMLPVGYAVNVSIESGRVIKMQNNLDVE